MTPLGKEGNVASSGSVAGVCQASSGSRNPAVVCDQRDLKQARERLSSLSASNHESPVAPIAGGAPYRLVIKAVAPDDPVFSYEFLNRETRD